jgi:phage shock protein A
MGIFKRFKDALRANINDLISKAENPEKMLNQIIMDMNEHLIEAKKSVASAIADEKRLERQMNENRARAQDWENKAVLAVKAEKDDLAKEALLRKEEYETYIKELEPQWMAQHESVNQLKDSLKQLQRKIEEAQRKKNILIARAKRAETQKKIQSMTGSIADTTAFEAFDRMAAKVEQIESEADAMTELSRAGQEEDTLEAEFKKLESSDTKADSLLEELKAKLRKIEDKRDEPGD